MKTEVFVGIDVSKQHLDVAVRPQGRHFIIPNDDRGLKQLLKRLTALKPQLIVLEASGGYELLATAALAEAQLPVALVNPLAVRQFAGATGKLAKTDKIDAQVLAHFAEAVRPEPRPLPDQEQQLLKAALQRRVQMVKMIGQEKNRLEKTFIPALRQDIQAHLAWLQTTLGTVGPGSQRSDPPESPLAGPGPLVTDHPRHRPGRFQGRHGSVAGGGQAAR